MVSSNQLTQGMTISINGKLYRVESSIKVTVPKGTPFIKARLRDLSNNELVEKNFKLSQAIKDVTLVERKVEYLYPEGDDYLFLDVGNLEKVLIPSHIVAQSVHYLKEGVELKAAFYGDSIFAVELPPFLELMVQKIQGEESGKRQTNNTNSTKIAILETGAKIEVPPFIEVGDIIKVDTRQNEYIQRV